MNLNKSKGLQYEELARDYLLNQGLTLHLQNYHCRFGEIDLIMLDKETLVFIEVRFRQNEDYGSSIETVQHASVTLSVI